MQFLEGRLGVKVFEQIRVQPLGNFLNGHELIRVVVELVPDGVDIAVLDRLYSGECRTLGEFSSLRWASFRSAP